MKKVLAGLVLAVSLVAGLTPGTADARYVKLKPAIVHEDEISGLLTRIDNIRATGDSDDAVLLAFWLEGATTKEITQALCIRSWETPGTNGVGVVNKRNHEDSGPMQINRRYWKAVAEAMGYTWDEVIWDPWVNAIVATEVWWRAGYSFTPWSTAWRCP